MPGSVLAHGRRPSDLPQHALPKAGAKKLQEAKGSKTPQPKLKLGSVAPKRETQHTKTLQPGSHPLKDSKCRASLIALLPSALNSNPRKSFVERPTELKGPSSVASSERLGSTWTLLTDAKKFPKT